MAEYGYFYGVKVSHITVTAQFKVFFDTKNKSYTIYVDDSGFWLQDDENNKCKLVYFMGDEEVMGVVTYGECGYLIKQGWAFIDKWKLEEEGN